MGSLAYSDFQVRSREVTYLLRGALRADDPAKSATLSKAACVLSAAALERYVNDVLLENCRKLSVETWDELTPGHQRFLLGQMAEVAKLAGERLAEDPAPDSRPRKRFERIIDECSAAFRQPSSWAHFPNYGMFMDGSAEPDKVNRIFKLFDAEGRNFFDYVETRGADRKALFTGVSQLINARHATAHALPDTPPGSTDVRTWVVLTISLVRFVEAFLGFRRK